MEPKIPRDSHQTLVNPLTILCYSIAVEAALLDQQLRVDMKRVFGKDGGDCSDIDLMRFYRPKPEPDAIAKFEEYIRRRWPLITFALYPQVDQQNIDDVNSTSRDLQIALAFAFSSGQINFQQLLQFQRKVVTDAEAVALNRTVTSFSHGDDTFGYRFTPRFQNPPPEKSNFGVIANTLISNGPGRNYQIKNSKLEPGQRELTVVIIMPSFLQNVRFDVTGNWFPLVDPDQMKTPTPRMIEQGREVVELREALNCIHDHKTYRKGDIQRLTTRVNQLEKMLPMQTQEIALPYENTIGGFQLFQQGTTALVPQLDAFEGVDTIDGSQDVDLILYGKHFSIQETYIVVGGKYLPLPLLDAATAAAAGAGPTTTTTAPTTTTTTPTGSLARTATGTQPATTGSPASAAATATGTPATANGDDSRPDRLNHGPSRRKFSRRRRDPESRLDPRDHRRRQPQCHARPHPSGTCPNSRPRCGRQDHTDLRRALRRDAQRDLQPPAHPVQVQAGRRQGRCPRLHSRNLQRQARV